MIMLWFPIALLGAISQAAYSLSVKVLLRRIPPFSLAGYSFLAGSLILFSLILLTGFPPLGPGLLPAVAATVAINVVATILFYRALSTTDLSLCIPILAFTPVFLILTSFIILGEIPSLAGAAGIFLVAAGAFLLTQKSGHGQSASLLTPFRTLRHEKGVRLMLLVAFLYSLSVNYDKEVVINSSPIFGSALIFFLLAAIFLLIAVSTGTRGSVAAKDPVEPDPVASHPPFPSSPLIIYGAVGMLLAVEGISINTAYTMAIVPYVITIKRMSIFFSVLFGWLLLHEQHIRGRMFGALVMISGAVVIALWG
jgi:drug/metabolite transporter (DMT)-like permease